MRARSARSLLISEDLRGIQRSCFLLGNQVASHFNPRAAACEAVFQHIQIQLIRCLWPQMCGKAAYEKLVRCSPQSSEFEAARTASPVGALGFCADVVEPR